MNYGYALDRAELVRALTAYSGYATADGAVTKDTIVDANLIGKNDFISKKTILIMSGDAAYEDKGAASFNPVTGTITLQSGFSAQIKAGTLYRILNISTVEIDVANIDTKIGTNLDPAGTTTLFAWLAKLFAGIGQGQGLAYYGKVTQVDDATHFRVATLTGFGDAFFANTHRVYVLRDAGGAGAAPQGEMQPCSGYTSSTGRFTHTGFSVGLAVNDEVLLIHERIAQIADLITRLGDPSAHVLKSLVAKWGDIARSLDLILGARWDAAGDLGTDIAAILASGLVLQTTINDVAPAVTDFDLAAGPAANDVLNGALCLMISGARAGECHVIDDYVAATKNVSFAAGDQWNAAPANGDSLVILPGPQAIAHIHSHLDFIRGATGIFFEQPDVAVNVNAIAGGETDVLNLAAPTTRYIVRSLRLKCADPGANTVTVRLYELVNDVLTEVDAFAITAANFGTYHSLMDMFGLPHLAGDRLQVTVRASAGGPYAVTGQYSHGRTNV